MQVIYLKAFSKGIYKYFPKSRFRLFINPQLRVAALLPLFDKEGGGEIF